MTDTAIGTDNWWAVFDKEGPLHICEGEAECRAFFDDPPTQVNFPVYLVQIVSVRLP